MFADELWGSKCFLISYLWLQIIMITLPFVYAVWYFGVFLCQEWIFVLDAILLLAEMIQNTWCP